MCAAPCCKKDKIKCAGSGTACHVKKGRCTSLEVALHAMPPGNALTALHTAQGTKCGVRCAHMWISYMPCTEVRSCKAPHVALGPKCLVTKMLTCGSIPCTHCRPAKRRAAASSKQPPAKAARTRGSSRADAAAQPTRPGGAQQQAAVQESAASSAAATAAAAASTTCGLQGVMPRAVHEVRAPAAAAGPHYR
eukprot:scaffold9960_cov20-Tisochrysis_lutea.AAC.2